MSTDLLPTGDALPSLADRMRYAEALAGARLLPGPYRRSPADVLLAVELAHALGIAPVTALSSVHVIDGKPSMSAELMRALVLRAGHTLRVVESTATRCVLDVARREQPDAVSRYSYDVDDARRAGLLPAREGSSWDKHPTAMLLARCSSYACRATFPDVLAGVSYTPDELGAAVDDTGTVVVGVVVDQGDEQQPHGDASRTPALDETRDRMGLPPRTDDRPATPAQLRALWARLHACRPRDEVHARWALGLLLTGSPTYVEHVGELTRAQLSTLLDYDRDAVAAALEATADVDDYAHPGDAEPDAVDVAALDDELHDQLDPEQLEQLQHSDQLEQPDVDGPPSRPVLQSDGGPA